MGKGISVEPSPQIHARVSALLQGGIGIYDVYIDENGHLILELENRQTFDCGSAIGPQGPVGPQGERGPIGPQGPKGEDGTVSFDQLTPEQIAMLKGDKGDPGETGPMGPAPVKGKDYWTDADKEELSQYALNAVQPSVDAAKQSATEAAESAKKAEEAADRAQSIGQGAQGYYETPESLRIAHPVGDAGWWAIVGSTDTIWVWDTDTGAWKDTFQVTDLSQYYTKSQTYSRQETDQAIGNAIAAAITTALNTEV